MRAKVLAFLPSCTRVVQKGKEKTVLALDISRSREEGLRFRRLPPTPLHHPPWSDTEPVFLLSAYQGGRRERQTGS